METPLIRDCGMALQTISSQFPEFSHSNIRFLGSGCDYTTFLLDEKAVFRFPQRNEYCEQIKFEIFVLKTISGKMPLGTPYPQWIGKEFKEYPYPFFGYSYIPGNQVFTMSASDVAVDTFIPPLVSTLEMLHSHEPHGFMKVVPSMSVYNDTPETMYVDKQKDYQEIKGHLSGDLKTFSDKFWSGGKAKKRTFDPNLKALIHSDLSMEHVIYNGGIAGIIDWGDVGIGNPIWDFVGIWMWGGDKFLLPAVKRYSLHNFTEYINTIRFLGICSAYGEMQYGYSTPSANHIRIAKCALRHGISYFDF